MSYDNNLSGALFKNTKKEKESHPDYRGECEIIGQKYEIAAWIKDSKAGNKYMSLSFQVPREKQDNREVPKANQSNSAPVDDFDDDIPFS